MAEFAHRAGAPLECICMALKVQKRQEGTDAEGNLRWKIGISIGGGIDQNHRQSVYSDSVCTGIYVTSVEANSPAEEAGLKVHDKILQVNGVDYTMITHERAVKYLKKEPVLDLLVTRATPKHSTEVQMFRRTEPAAHYVQNKHTFQSMIRSM